ncbi:MAG: response regulator transcription factor [Bacteroidia bacterium]|nr:response regulator transcription factor [Bacteroidia bacterium]
MQRAIIIDDEKQARSALRQEIGFQCPDLEIIGEAGSVEEGVKLLTEKEVDLIFLDIQLSDGVGFEILEKLKTINFRVIFTTAYSEYALRAFRFNAIDYLVKPIDGEELREAVSRLELAQDLGDIDPVENFFRNQALKDPFKKIALQTSEGIHLIELRTIVRLNSEGNYTRFYFSNGQKMLVGKTLKDFELMLAPFGFERVHLSHIINLSHLNSYMNKDGGYLVLSDESTVPVSQRKRARLIDLLNSFNKI